MARGATQHRYRASPRAGRKARVGLRQHRGHAVGQPDRAPDPAALGGPSKAASASRGGTLGGAGLGAASTFSGEMLLIRIAGWASRANGKLLHSDAVNGQSHLATRVRDYRTALLSRALHNAGCAADDSASAHPAVCREHWDCARPWAEPEGTLFVSTSDLRCSPWSLSILLINATWSLDLPTALDKVLWFGLVVVLTFGASRALGRWNQHQTRVAVIACLAGTTAGLAFILFELATAPSTDAPAVQCASSDARPDSLKTLKVKNGQVVSIAAFELNRNVAVMLLMLWPALLCLSRLTDRLWRSLGIAALFLRRPPSRSCFRSTRRRRSDSLPVPSFFWRLGYGDVRPTRDAGPLVPSPLRWSFPSPLCWSRSSFTQAEWQPPWPGHESPCGPTRPRKFRSSFLGIGLTSTRKLSADRTLPHRQEAVGS